MQTQPADRLDLTAAVTPERSRQEASPTPPGEGASKNDCYVPVFAKGARLSGLPKSRMREVDAQELVDAKKARWVSRSSAIQLSFEASQYRLHGLSCIAGVVVIERAAMGSRHHAIIASSWRGIVENVQAKPFPLTPAKGSKEPENL